MRRLALVVSTCLLAGCGTLAQVRLGSEPLSHPDPKVVQSYVCAGEEDAARLYLAAPTFAWIGPNIERYLTDARELKTRGGCPCSRPSCSN